MRKVRIGNRDVTLYDDIESLPMARFHKFSKLLLVDAGIGSDLSDIDTRIARTVQFIRDGKQDQAVQEMSNLRQAVAFIHEGLSPRHLAFCCLVSEIDGKPRDDISDDGLKETQGMLGGVPVKEADRELSTVKKKIDAELTAYFPGMFDSAEATQYYILMARRTRLMLDDIISGEDRNRGEIERIGGQLTVFYRAESFSGRDNVEIRSDRGYGDMCVWLSQTLGIDPRDYTVMEFYNAYDFAQRQAKEREKAMKKRR